MRITQLFGFIIKSILVGLICGLLILFFLPDSKLPFNWHTAKQAWQYMQQHQKAGHKSSPQTATSIYELSFAKAVEKALPSVVSINVLRPKSTGENSLSSDEKIVGVGFGSGIILKDGYIVTNYHVIKNSERISINLSDGRRRWVQLVGFDAKTDIAILKTDIPDLQAAQLANSSEVKAGDLVMAIGNPFGSTQSSVSLGIVSAITHNPIAPRIQTDAALNDGNSGGPLINTRGEIVGINQISLSSRGGGQTGVNYAIPIDKVKSIVEDIIDFGKVKRNWLGIDVGELPYRDSTQNGMVQSIMVVRNVESQSPAEKSGIQAGDIISKMDERPIKGISAFYEMFYNTPIGSVVEFEIIRQEKTMHKTVQLVEEP